MRSAPGERRVIHVESPAQRPSIPKRSSRCKKERLKKKITELSCPMTQTPIIMTPWMTKIWTP
jgi:hypothetical protein